MLFRSEGVANEWNKKDRTASVSSLLVDLDGQGGGLNREALLELRAEGMAADIKEEDERFGRGIGEVKNEGVNDVESEVKEGPVVQNGEEKRE